MPLTIDLKDRGALVFGGSRGIGLAIATRLSEAGARVAVASRDPEQAARELSGDGVPIVVDLATDDVADAVRRAGDALGTVDVLVYAAGCNLRRPLADVTLDDFRWVQRVNVESAFAAAQACAAGMTRRGWGRMLFVTSLLGQFGGFGSPLTAYTTSKAALGGLIRGLAYELSPAGVTVNGIAPGYIRTELTRPLWEDPEMSARLAGRVLAGGRWGEPDDVAGMAAFLCSEHAGYVTGQTYNVDGGFSIA